MSEVPEIDVATLAERRASGDIALFDVREEHEYDEAHVPGAVLVPLATVPDELARFPRDRPVYVICRSGARSRKAAQFLRTNGVDAINVDGGTLAWLDSGQPYESC